MKHRLNIFISYRRVDSSNFAGRLYDNLLNDFDVFFDTVDTTYGEDFPDELRAGIDKSDVMLLVIGKKCCEEFQSREGRSDFVLEEILYAESVACTVIPVLMDGVSMPSCFPKGIEFISQLTAFEFRHSKFAVDMRELKEKLNERLPKPTEDVDNDFLKEVLDATEKERLVVLFTQDFTYIDYITKT